MTDTNQASEDKLGGILEDLIYDTPNSYGYPPDFDPDFAKAKQAIIDWHNKQVKNAVATAEDNLDQYWNKELNKQVEAVLDRLESQSRRADECTDDTLVVKMIRVGAERDRLNPSKSTPFNKLKESK